MIFRSRTLLLVIIVFAVFGVLFGCGSDKREGRTQTTTIGPSTEGNLQSTITGVTISSPPVVTFTLFDENGAPLSPTSEGLSVRFTIAQLNTDGNYQNYIMNSSGQPTFDSGGTFATVGSGTYTYTFATDITADPMYNPALTQTVGAQIEREITSPVGTPFQQAVNPYFNFVPNGDPVTRTREVVAISNCNECHGKLGLHGGGRRDVALCILCHNPGPIDPDTGNPIDMKILIHKIHMGENLPSNEAGGNYTIIGFRGSVHSYKTVAFPFISGDSFISGTPIDCIKCHSPGEDLAGRAYGKDVEKFRTDPTIVKCTTCHDLTTFDGSTTITVKDGATPITVDAIPHSAGPQADGSCGVCHPPTGPEYGFSVTGAHTVLEQSSVFTGINFEILSVENAVAGSAPAVTFRATTDSGAVIDPATASFNLKLGYPTTDYRNDGMNDYGQPLTQPLAGAINNGDGTFTMTFGTPIPAGISGVGVIGLEGRDGYDVTTIHKGAQTFNVGGKAVQYYFDLTTGAQVTDPSMQRRRIVDVNKCINCHTRLSLHGANRVNSIEECVICHNPNATDKSRRPEDPATTPDGLAERAIDFKRMIHKIHTGEELEASKPYVIYGFGGSVNDFSEVRFPRDRRDCLGCHIDAEPKTFGLPLPPGVLGTTISTGAIANDGSDNTRILPITSICTACHDTELAMNHAASRVVNGVETCTECHSTGLLLGPDLAHFPER
jgi:OmcA/MtrC family decaheme c-type cytochrome